MSQNDLETSMQKSVESTQRMFNTIRTGRANSSLLDRISVEYYGADTPLKSLATLSTPDSQTIQIQPFDLSALAAIEKASP
jgi:Ribosome recycling factor